ncbi:hypothetical protein FGG08_003152 [Glutinoglossum americanum]|uniref:Ubiquitin-like protease family profile domain-containing protein n=1 Tax=Glutinoglossum americanum TaxID=1670608 RepID=A0A9P8HYY0_9PEZI|nr:hypothetical protein FGG08_003152 [Glutinoglossum americanum]
MEETADGGIEASKNGSFRGTARVHISRLSFDNNTGKRAISKKNINRLHRIFQLEGCLRLDSENDVPVQIEEDILAQALAESRLIDQDLKLLPNDGKPHFLHLPQNYQLECLHGQHRILAGKKYLEEEYVGEEEELWWTVKLYLKGSLSKDACIRIQEQHPNSQPVSDGEIFQKIRYYHKQDNVQAEGKWWARLSDTKQKDVKQLLKMEEFVLVLDELLEIPGLWSTVKLGTLHRFLTLKCDEEMLHFLRHILFVWDKILDRVPRSAIDQLTVANLELRTPMVSRKDSREIYAMMETVQLFPSVSDPAVRQTLLRNLSTISCLIPSMRVFLENLKYLEPCCNVLKGLMNFTQSSTIRQCLFKSYVAPPCLLVETCEGKLQSATATDNKLAAYLQLWIYAMRNFPEMVAVAPKKELGQEKPVVLEPNPKLWIEISKMAVSLGFRTPKALKWGKQNPDESVARAFLLRARPPTKYEFTSITIDMATKQIAKILSMAKQIKAKTRTLRLTLPHGGESRDRRCGRPFENSQIFDQEFLFLPYMSGEDAPNSGEDISSFFVKRNFLRSFFDTSIGVNLSQSNNGESNTATTALEPDDTDLMDVDTVTQHTGNLAATKEMESKIELLQKRVHEIQIEARREIESLLGQLARQQQQSAKQAQAEKECIRRAENAEMAMHEKAGELESQLQQIGRDRLKNDELKLQLETISTQMRNMEQSKQQMQLRLEQAQNRPKGEQQKNNLYNNRETSNEQQKADLVGSMLRVQELELELEKKAEKEELLQSQLNKISFENNQLQSTNAEQQRKYEETQRRYLEKVKKYSEKINESIRLRDEATERSRTLELQSLQDRKEYQEKVNGQLHSLMQQSKEAIERYQILESQSLQDRKEYQEKINDLEAQLRSQIQRSNEACQNFKLQNQALELQAQRNHTPPNPDTESTFQEGAIISKLKAIANRPTTELRRVHFEVFEKQPTSTKVSIPLDEQLVNELSAEVLSANWSIFHPSGSVIPNARMLFKLAKDSAKPNFSIVSKDSVKTFREKQRMIIIKRPNRHDGSDSEVQIRSKKDTRHVKKRRRLGDLKLNEGDPKSNEEGAQDPLPEWVLYWNPEWQKILDDAMKHSPDYVLATTSANSRLTQRSFQTLLPDYGSPNGQGRSGWLDDEIVNAYMQLLVDDASKRGQKAFALNSFFYKKLAESGPKSVERWTKRIKVGDKGILDADAIYIPVNQNNHWTMFVILSKEKCIAYLDSLNGTGIEQVRKIKEWLEFDLGKLWVEKEWTTYSSSPQQKNAKDCGVFAVTSAKMISLQYDPLSYSFANINTIRKKMVVELIKGEILRDEEQL